LRFLSDIDYVFTITHRVLLARQKYTVYESALFY
jgi:hypothetical protein